MKGRYLHLGQWVMVPADTILGIFDLDNTTWSFRTRQFLEQAEEAGEVVMVGEDLPRSFVLCQQGAQRQRVYLSQLNTTTLRRRAEQDRFE
ncbi:MAG TPA: DUF370 domain-containing protein [Clostridiales bacterium]|nr:DUF370 domain-containing protein [Clostridiales bacterium]